MSKEEAIKQIDNLFERVEQEKKVLKNELNKLEKESLEILSRKHETVELQTNVYNHCSLSTNYRGKCDTQLMLLEVKGIILNID